MLFLFHEQEGKMTYARPVGVSQTLPIRLVDYFVVVGMGALQVSVAVVL
jgi:hypothetical protein